MRVIDEAKRRQPSSTTTLAEQGAKPPFSVQRARPLCEWPMVPRYKGGDAATAASFACER